MSDSSVGLLSVARGLPASKGKDHRRINPEARGIIERAQDTLSAEGAGPIQVMLKTGSPARVIVDLAADYDVTVIGAKGREDRSRGGGLGPVASAVVSHASGAVFIGRPTRADRGPRILVAVDGSEASVQALGKLTSLFALESAEVTLMNVVESPWLHVGSRDEPFDEEEEAGDEIEVSEELLLGELRSEAVQLIDKARDQLLAEHPAVRTIVDQGNPATQLLSEAETGEYDLVVLGETDAVDLKHKLLGSVSAQIAWNAPCSVLVVKSEA